jgi:hypothetical protein
MMDNSTFQLSRIYGQGWKAAKKELADRAEGSLQPIAGSNPYTIVEERERWSKGFEDGLRSRTGARVISNHQAWRPQGRR